MRPTARDDGLESALLLNSVAQLSPPRPCLKSLLIISNPSPRNLCEHSSKVCASSHPKNSSVEQAGASAAIGRASERIRKRRGIQNKEVFTFLPRCFRAGRSSGSASSNFKLTAH